MRAAMSFGVAIAAFALGTAQAAAAGQFDGAWTVDIDCPDAGDVHGFDWRFPIRVSGGAMTGHYVSAKTEATASLSGFIRPDGEASLAVSGRTGPGKYNLNHVGPGTPYHFTAAGRFSGVGGTAARNDRRTCSLTFTR